MYIFTISGQRDTNMQYFFNESKYDFVKIFHPRLSKGDFTVDFQNVLMQKQNKTKKSLELSKQPAKSKKFHRIKFKIKK